MTVCEVMPSSTSFYLILLVYFFSLFIEGFHLDPLPEPLGSYMSGKNYILFIKQEGVCFINAMHFFCPRWQNVFLNNLCLHYSQNKKQDQIQKKGKQTKGNLEVQGQDDLKSPYYQSLLLSTELQCRKGGSAWITSSLWSCCSLNLFPFVKVVFRAHASVNR